MINKPLSNDELKFQLRCLQREIRRLIDSSDGHGEKIKDTDAKAEKLKKDKDKFKAYKAVTDLDGYSKSQFAALPVAEQRELLFDFCKAIIKEL